MRCNPLLLVPVFFVCVAVAQADLVDIFADYDAVFEVGVSGLVSSYADATQGGNPISGFAPSTGVATLGPERVSYPNGIGPVPSPGGAIGAEFDEGALGYKLEGDSLLVQVASRLDPLAGYYHNGWGTWYGQGDIFLDVFDGEAISHFALLNYWPRNGEGAPVNLNRGHFDAAQAFHLGTGGDGSREGSLVALAEDADVGLAGGRGAYNGSIAPDGLDLRVFAQGGTVLGESSLMLSTVEELGKTWHLQTWSVPLAALTDAEMFEIGLHVAASCGNDQIGLGGTVPEPSALMLLLAGVVGSRRVFRGA